MGYRPDAPSRSFEDDPDVVVYATRNRLYLSRDGGTFWSSLAVELPEIEAVEIRS